MNEITNIILQATCNLPSPQDLAAHGEPLTARDWAGFFKALADFAAALLPLLLPLFAKTKTD